MYMAPRVVMTRAFRWMGRIWVREGRKVHDYWVPRVVEVAAKFGAELEGSDGKGKVRDQPCLHFLPLAWKPSATNCEVIS